MQGTNDIWEARVTSSYRITFQWTGESLFLRRFGSHDVLKKES
jgi:mRNA interferase RelE/StbE